MIYRSLLLVLLVLACLQSFTTANNGKGPDQCCTDFVIQPIPVRVITAYAVTDIQCPKPGVIFTLQNGRHVCADPGFKWVKHHMYRIKERLFNSLNKPTGSLNSLSK
ncbi:C-C motif chemokine 18-like [Tachysurus fulvidraco]|uniref:C-C motif chemokine 18-like n=1 Tax=Tachysurus fulvidraco TaxID=1234273 RepID=UPI000F4D8455|nr:C-C motif chemokine 18-like [Tachysurus fulvidraco]